jgi:hypothetical protein
MLKFLHKTNMQNELLDELTEEEEQRAKAEKKKAEKRYSSMTTIEKFDHLAKYHGTEGTLDLQNAILPRRFKNIKNMKLYLKLSLQPLVTLRERDALVEVSECKNQNDVEELLSKLYQKRDLSPNEKYIRFALAAAHEIWPTGLLKKKGHGEDWYRLHVYSNIWDKAFVLDGDFETKRSECISQITSALQEIDGTTNLQKVDFILSDLNTENDFLSVEEKPSRKGVKADLKKGSTLQKQTLQLWPKKIKSIPLIGELEAITCQWEGLKLTTFASPPNVSPLVECSHM